MSGLGKLLLKSLCGFLGLWPRKLVRALGIPLGVLWFDILRVRRKVVLDNLRIAFPEWSENKRIQAGRRSVYQLTQNFFEVFLVPAMSKDWLKKNFVFDGEQNLIEALSQGKGVYALSLHLGNGDIGASSLAALGYPTYLITKTFKNKFVNNLWFQIRQAQGVQFIDAHGSKTPFEILKVIKAKQIVIFVNDQFMGKPFGIRTHFFGRETGTAYGLAVFYLKTGSPIVPTYTFEGEDGKVHLKTEPALQLEHLISDDKDQTYFRITQEINNVLERIIKEHPSQWMWVHRRWKSFE